VWVFCPVGFYSVVAVDPRHARELGLGLVPHVMVRARHAPDLERLVQFWREPPPIHYGRGTDYPCRIIVSREEYARVLLELADAIDYTNHKGAVHAARGAEVASLYGEVWRVMLRAERWLDASI
jgi:hypothetical protein